MYTMLMISLFKKIILKKSKKLQQTFQNNNVLKFIYALNINNKIPFLDELIDGNNDNLNPSVYIKKHSSNN